MNLEPEDWILINPSELDGCGFYSHQPIWVQVVNVRRQTHRGRKNQRLRYDLKRAGLVVEFRCPIAPRYCPRCGVPQSKAHNHYTRDTLIEDRMPWPMTPPEIEEYLCPCSEQAN